MSPNASGSSACAPATTSNRRLACLSCKRKKVKCLPGPLGSTSCELCCRTSEPCSVPEFDHRRKKHANKVIDHLREENKRLKAELAYHRAYCLLSVTPSDGEAASISATEEISCSPSLSDEHDAPEKDSKSTEETPNSSDNMIVRLCGGFRQLNSDRAGRLRYFGPTSSLHLMESVTSSLLMQSSGRIRGAAWQDDFPPEIEQYLLDLYWKFLHGVSPCIHRQAFLEDMRSGSSKYCSRLLVYCMLTRAAAISDQPGLRALALADNAEDDPPYLVRKCVQLLDTELDSPGITTAQSLQLLSEMHCAISHDTKGWMYAGGAANLIFELGLHRDSQQFDNQLSDVDKQVRQTVFWSCFSLDREWSLYLGRPQFIKLEDIDVKQPSPSLLEDSTEVRLSAAWTSLLMIIGKICGILNGVQTPHHHMEHLDQNLRGWMANLDQAFRFHALQDPPVILLHMQHAAALILLHRPLAQFGKDAALRVPTSEHSRRICIDNACLVSRYCQQYFDQHGSVMTMSWIALHIVATAATTLIANVAEKDETSISLEDQLSSLRICLGTLNELEKSHVVTRRVRRVIQQAIRLLNLESIVNGGIPGRLDPAFYAYGGMGNERPVANQDSTSLYDLLPTGFQFDMLNSFESYFT